MVAFGWGRVGAVAAELRQRDASGRLSLVPDVGKKDEAGRIARDVRGAVAALPNGWPVNADVHDFAQRDGAHALTGLLSRASALPPLEPRHRLLTADELRELPPLAWCVRGVLPAVGLSALFGPSSSGKSFLVLDLAAAIAGGWRWFGHRVTPAHVVYAALEGEAGFKLRAQAWETHRGQRLPEGLRLMLQPFWLTEPHDVADLAGMVPAGAVVFLDTLNRTDCRRKLKPRHGRDSGSGEAAASRPGWPAGAGAPPEEGRDAGPARAFEPLRCDGCRRGGGAGRRPPGMEGEQIEGRLGQRRASVQPGGGDAGHR